MEYSHLVRAALLLLACNSSSLIVPSDGGAASASDLGPPDLAGATCAQIATATQSWIDGHLACTRASDCAVTNTNCGQPGQCGAYLQASALPGLMSIDDAWKNGGCTGPCPPCAFPAPATCDRGKCVPLGFSDRPVGSPCGGDSECHTEGQYAGQCLLTPSFTNGDCVLPCAHGFGCPLPNMECRPLPNGAFDCFAACTSDSDCRTGDGYRCCPDWGGAGSPGSVCYPSPCPI
jgi:hypothetical protein